MIGLIGGICLWEAGNRKIQAGGRYTIKFWGVGVVIACAFVTLGNMGQPISACEQAGLSPDQCF